MELFALLSPSVFPLEARTDEKGSRGSAIALTENLAVTNCHVVVDKSNIFTNINDKRIYFGPPVGDRKKDICFITSEEKLRPVSATRNYSDLKVGEKVFAIGSPKGLRNSFSEGLISGLRIRKGVSVIQTSAAISRGSSGGALFDAQGRLIGITTFKVTTGESLNFAIAIDEALKLMPSKTAHAR
ncbi:MAG: trypsin-like peptidase domain-containing protein [Gammaproteobacteria bacterium]|nr:trypsin-like peptidase domain-containing protein [Gammaproteobacteria bacterium]